MTLEEERDYWKETSQHSIDCWEKLIIENHILKRICNDLILKYSDHQKNCNFKLECSCGYNDLINELKNK